MYTAVRTGAWDLQNRCRSSGLGVALVRLVARRTNLGRRSHARRRFRRRLLVHIRPRRPLGLVHEPADARSRREVDGVRPKIQHAARNPNTRSKSHLLGDGFYASVLESEEVGIEADCREGDDAYQRERLDEREVERRDAVGAYILNF